MSDELKALDDAHRILVSKSQDLSIPIAGFRVMASAAVYLRLEFLELNRWNLEMV